MRIVLLLLLLLIAIERRLLFVVIPPILRLILMHEHIIQLIPFRLLLHLRITKRMLQLVVIRLIIDWMVDVDTVGLFHLAETHHRVAHWLVLHILPVADGGFEWVVVFG